MSDLDIYNNLTSYNDFNLSQYENNYDLNLYSDLNDDTMYIYEPNLII